MSRADPDTDRCALLLIADDLTGAADAAVGYCSQGRQTLLSLDPSRPAHMTEIVALDLHSRSTTSECAAKRHRTLITQWHGHFDELYKKIDSTLRGNVATEIAALVPQVGMAIVAPALPAQRRTTLLGRQWLEGVPVEDTPVWQNEGLTGRADLIEMLEGVALNVIGVTLDTVRNAPLLAHTLDDAYRRGVQAVVCDAETDDDLRRIADAGRPLEHRFWVGSAGLSAHLHLPSGQKSKRASVPRSANSANGPTLGVIGSMSTKSHRQADKLLARYPEIAELDIATDTLLQPDDMTLQRLRRTLHAAFEAGQDVLVRLQRPDEHARTASGSTLSHALAALLAPHVPGCRRLIATGGETARALLDAVGLQHALMIDAPAPGMARFQADTLDGLEIVTKAGAFGTDDALITAWGLPALPSFSFACVHAQGEHNV